MLRRPSTFSLFCYLFACIVSFTCHAETAPPSIPLAQLERYSAVSRPEMIESMEIDRLHLEGPQTIVIELPHGYRVDVNVKHASVAFINQLAPDYSCNFYSFLAKAFKYKLTDQTLNAYMAHLAQGHSPEAKFEIIEAAEATGGRAKFRILGRKALTLRYALTVDKQRIIVAENWVQYEDKIYVVSILGPERVFEHIFKQLRVELNSMHLAE